MIVDIPTDYRDVFAFNELTQMLIQSFSMVDNYSTGNGGDTAWQSWFKVS